VTNDNPLARRLRILRAERGLSLTDAAEQCDIERNTLSDLERGRRHPYYPTLAKIARGYGLDVEELVDLEPAPPKEGAPESGQQPKAEEVTGEDIGFSHEVESDLFERVDVRAWLQGVEAERLLMSDDELLAEWQDLVESKPWSEDAVNVLAKELQDVIEEEKKVERALTSLLNKRGTILGDDDQLPMYTRIRRMLRARYEYVYRGIETFNANLFARGEAEDVVTYSKRRLDLIRPKLEELRKEREAALAKIQQEAVEA
jgi:transcriptional regulator with XRE-family HTH domain